MHINYIIYTITIAHNAYSEIRTKEITKNLRLPGFHKKIYCTSKSIAS